MKGKNVIFLANVNFFFLQIIVKFKGYDHLNWVQISNTDPALTPTPTPMSFVKHEYLNKIEGVHIT